MFTWRGDGNSFTCEPPASLVLSRIRGWDWRSQGTEDIGAVPLGVRKKYGIEDRALCAVT